MEKKRGKFANAGKLTEFPEREMSEEERDTHLMPSSFSIIDWKEEDEDRKNNEARSL